MIKFINNIFVDNIKYEDVDKIKRKLRLGTGMINTKVIMLAENGNDVFEIVPASMFKQRYYRHKNHTVIGLASSEADAYKIIEDIVIKHYELTGKYTDLRNDFINMMIED